MVDILMTERKNVMNFLEEETEPDRNSEHGRKRSTDEHGQSSDVDQASPKPKQPRIDSSPRNSEEGKEKFETKSKATKTENGKTNEPMSVEDDSSVDEPSKDEGIGSKETGMDVVDLTSDHEEEESKTKILDQKKKMLLKKMLLAKMKAKSADSDESSSDEESTSGEDSGEDESNDSDVIVEKVVERPKELFQNFSRSRFRRSWKFWWADGVDLKFKNFDFEKLASYEAEVFEIIERQRKYSSDVIKILINLAMMIFLPQFNCQCLKMEIYKHHRK